MKIRLWPITLLFVGLWLFLGQPWRPSTAPAPATHDTPAEPLPVPSPTDGLPATPLPREALDTIALIQRGGPFPYRQDGSVFGNRERRLPDKPRGWYREYTVKTPGLSHRGARRIVTGGDPPDAWYYTDDHYERFRRVEVPR
ncbi:ribonuclease [Lysobacter pythonis]|uniref:Ribonuclease n=1 Tax=Solilutibacter pythonis TaxID=2483112 RepID=A0A3M2HXG1_9GAMM|nr:ribonuclease domain-containing protein [Lysobacter pythonis]RMH90877.1 ribonuclease [Lysobacter pythonis]